MRIASLGFLIGVAIFQQLSILPALTWSGLLLLLVPAAWFFPKWRLWLCIGMGFFWVNIMAHHLLANGLDPVMEAQDVVVEGLIASLPETMDHGIQFQFEPDLLRKDGIKQPLPGKLLLSWYGRKPQLRVGERWRLLVRLKRPHGYMNPGGFDFEGWLFRQGIRAKGYVRSADDINERLAAPADHYVIDQIRQSLRDRLAKTLGKQELRGVVYALAIGDRQDITRSQWDVLTRTGTNHLVAISGLHIGLVAGFAFFLMRRLWQLSARAVRRWPAAKAGAMAGLLAATIYAMLSGFSVPTQRALLMVAVVMLSIVLQRRTRPSSILALALWLVLLIDPMAVLAPGFWLSFAAVALIFYGMTGRLGGDQTWRKWWWQWGRVQWLVTMGLFPILIALFQKASLVSPLANLIAVPWVSLVTVPLTLLGTVFLTLLPSLAHALLLTSLWTLDLLWWVLQLLSSWHFAQWRQGIPSFWGIASAVLGTIWLLAPRGISHRWVGAVWLLPLVFTSPASIADGEADFTLLDVGQGLSAVVHTRHHALVFDTGPRFATGFNTGDAVVAPYLRENGISHVDTLMVSHGDTDHIGGVTDLVAQIPVKRIISSVPDKLKPLSVEKCRAGEHWQWDGVHFEVLNPDWSTDIKKGRKANNRSCVLRVQAGKDSVLLTGDIERGAEDYLIDHWHGKLASSVLVVPHHGSKTSSTPAFINAVSPRIALLPVGYRNRYGFPKAAVVKRYKDRNVRLFDSASHGAIEIWLGAADKSSLAVHTWRQTVWRYWNYQPLVVISALSKGW
jgi:competence protein ComEC